tara:strand:- start:335 stop:619 length:285 start_codon:yes stop_codon:yes gene_type:complete
MGKRYSSVLEMVRDIELPKEFVETLIARKSYRGFRLEVVDECVRIVSVPSWCPRMFLGKETKPPIDDAFRAMHKYIDLVCKRWKNESSWDREEI